MPVIHGNNYADLLKSFQEGGSEQLQIITDFDETLTTFVGSDGAKGLQCHEIILKFMDTSALGLKEELSPLLEWHGMSEDARMQVCEGSVDERKKRSRWWFETFQQVSAKFELWRQVAACLELSNTKTRYGLAETFDILQESGIPLLIVSAGLQQFISAVFERNDVKLSERTEIVSNDMTSPSVRVTSRNKADIASTLAHEHFQLAAKEGRRHILVMGDKPADCNVVLKGFDGCQVLKVGFMKGSPSAPAREEERLDDYLQHFDIILTDDAPLCHINEIIRTICATTNDRKRKLESLESSGEKMGALHLQPCSFSLRQPNV